MPNLASLKLQQQASFLLRYVSATTFRGNGLPAMKGQADDYLDTYVVDPLRNYSDRLLIADKVPTVEQLLREIKTLLPAQSGPATGPVRIRIDSLVRRLTAALEEERGGWMPGEVGRIFESLRRAVEQRYARSCGGLVDPPAVFLEFKDVHRYKSLEPTGLISISGACQFDDGDDLISIVRLVVRDKGFDWPSACALPYVFAHELLCHAYQGMDRRGGAAPREITDPSCAWSEGWMDVLALRLTEDWVNAGSGVPDWIRLSRTQVLSGCMRFHSERYQPQPNPTPAELRNRMYARGGVDALLAEYSNLDSSDALDIVYAFSLTLNLASMPQKRRNDLVDLISIGLEVLGEVDRGELLSEIADFPSYGDWEELERRLKASVLAAF